MSVTFRKAPINEVALAYSFLPRPDLLVPHLGQFWGHLSDVYPKCQHAQPLIERSEVEVSTELPLPRLWFLSEDESKLVQLQRDRLVCNWRDLTGAVSYVRFPAVQAEFERVQALWESYVERVTGQPITRAAYSLTYVNVVRSAGGWSSPAEIARTFPDLQWRSGGRFLPDPSEFAWKKRFDLPRQFGTLGVEIQSAKYAKTNEPIVKFELVARSPSLGGKEIAFGDWVTVAHEWIVSAFTDLTSESVQRELWGLVEGSE